MTRQLRPDEAGAKGIRRVIRKELEEAQRTLARRTVTDRDVHDTRKLLKRTRAALRLARPALGRRAYRRENVALRDAARPLSAIRDARILIDAFDRLTHGAPPRDRRAWRPVRAVLVREQRRLRRRGLEKRGALRPALRSLRSSQGRIERWSAPRAGWKVIGRGLERVYRAGRKAGTRARRRPTVENLHEWRKQVKYLWHQLQLLEPVWPVMLRELGDQAHKLSDHLGDDHDLAVLEARLKRSPARPRGASGEKLERRIASHRSTLQAKAFALGARLFEERPAAFLERLGGYWRAWRAAGDAMAGKRGSHRQEKTVRGTANGRASHP